MDILRSLAHIEMLCQEGYASEAASNLDMRREELCTFLKELEKRELNDPNLFRGNTEIHFRCDNVTWAKSKATLDDLHRFMWLKENHAVDGVVWNNSCACGCRGARWANTVLNGYPCRISFYSKTNDRRAFERINVFMHKHIKFIIVLTEQDSEEDICIKVPRSTRSIVVKRAAPKPIPVEEPIAVSKVDPREQTKQANTAHTKKMQAKAEFVKQARECELIKAQQQQKLRQKKSKKAAMARAK